ncbi:MAG TPA: S8 family serine peptidase [Candidatus Thermoplasmatota archaeon]|nr:S8 family serine peptidase [Candidatus Thermoplasmatota archaeon]
MRAILAAALVAMSATLPAAAAVDLLTAPLGPAQRYIVGFHEAPTYRVGDEYEGNPIVAVDGDLRFVVVETNDPATLEVRARLDDRVRYLEWDNPQAAFLDHVPNDARYGDAGHWGSKKIGAQTAWDRTLGSTAIKVATIDSGLKKTHEDIAGARVLQGYDFVNNDNDPNDQGSACSYHGSHTAGTAGATINNAKGIAGISQHAILPVKVFYPYLIYCTSSTTALVNGLKYAGDQGAHVSSNSWGSSASSTALNDAVQYAHGKGTIHVAAAGNSGSCTNCVSYPWKDKGSVVIVVSATTSSDGFASFSSQGPQVDVAAPGVGILSVDGAGTTGYRLMDGTSMAAPHVSGTAALIKALNPSFTFAQVEGRITGTAVDLGTAGKDDRFGYGRLNAAAAVY